MKTTTYNQTLSTLDAVWEKVMLADRINPEFRYFDGLRSMAAMMINSESPEPVYIAIGLDGLHHVYSCKTGKRVA